MTRIFKYELHGRGTTTVNIPKGARVLSVANQDEALMLWAAVTPSNPTEPRTFLVALTGQEIAVTPSFPFLGTVLFDNGNFVVHVFEVTKETRG